MSLTDIVSKWNVQPDVSRYGIVDIFESPPLVVSSSSFSFSFFVDTLLKEKVCLSCIGEDNAQIRIILHQDDDNHNDDSIIAPLPTLRRSQTIAIESHEEFDWNLLFYSEARKNSRKCQIRIRKDSKCSQLVVVDYVYNESAKG